jgi:peptide/nickel transport system substrate-binding protein
MYENKKVLRIIAGLIFLLFLAALTPAGGLAAPAEKPVTAKEWAEKIGLDWGPKYWPTKPVRGGIFNTASPLYIGLMNPNHYPVNDWVAIGYFYERLIITDGKYRPTVPWLAESWKYLNDVTVVMKLRQGG